MELTLGQRKVSVTLTRGAPKVVQKVAKAPNVVQLGRTGLQGPPGSRVVEVGCSITGEAGGGELLLRQDLRNEVTFLAEDSGASIEAPPDAPVVVTATLDHAPFASVAFEPGSTEGVITFDPSALDGPKTGLLRIYAPQATIADFSITFSGVR